MMYDLTDANARNPLIAITVFAVIAIVTTILRLKSVKLKKLDLGLEDYLLLAALFFLLVSIGIQFACVIAGGVGRHIVDVDPLDAIKTLKLILPFEALYGVTLCLIKVSAITFYLRIFGTARSFRISAYVAIAILIAWGVSVVLETFLLCRPLAFNWDPTIAGSCGNRNTVYVTAGALNVVTDFMVMALPIPHIITLQLALRKKLGLVLMFSLGIFITIISILRIKSLQIISFTDPTFTLPMGLFWTSLEPCLCIINANLPMVRNYLVTSYPNIFGSTKDHTYISSGAVGQRTVDGAYSGSKARSGTRSRANEFEMLNDGFEDADLRSDGTRKVRNIITVGGNHNKDLYGDDVESVGSQRHLTMDTKGHIMVGKTVDVDRS